MASVNKAIIIGNLGADPELRHTAGGSAVCNLRVATTETWKDRDGNKQEKTEWHRIVVWGNQAEACGKYLSKGRQVYVEGSLDTREWQDKDGNRRTTTEIKARQVVFLGSGSGGGGGSREKHRTTEQRPQQPQGGGGWAGDYAPEAAAPTLGDEDMPF